MCISIFLILIRASVSRDCILASAVAKTLHSPAQRKLVALLREAREQAGMRQVDLAEKLVTHVLYFNEAWNPDDGGCLEVLNSSNPSDVAATILPVVGNSALVVRSDQSWHSVWRVTKSCRTSRRSINVIFHLPGSVSTMWPPGENPALRDYAPDP